MKLLNLNLFNPNNNNNNNKIILHLIPVYLYVVHVKVNLFILFNLIVEMMGN